MSLYLSVHWVGLRSTSVLFHGHIHFKLPCPELKRVGYNMDSMRQSACLVVNPITVDIYGFLFNYTTVGQASDLMTALA